MELGDHDQALQQIQRGPARCEGLLNARLESVLRINRRVVRTELGRAAQGHQLLLQAQALQHTLLPDERVELAVAQALHAGQGGDAAAALQTEVLQPQHRLEEHDIKRHATERARAEMALANLALSRKIQRVQLLSTADDLRRAAKRAGRRRVMQRGGCALAIAKPD
jgi:hypothetical protein